MEFDQAIERLEELRRDLERERFSAAAHQLQAWIGYLTMRPLIYSRRDVDTFTGDVPSEEG